MFIAFMITETAVLIVYILDHLV